MVQADSYCIDILTQVAAATKASTQGLTEVSAAISRLMRV